MQIYSLLKTNFKKAKDGFFIGTLLGDACCFSAKNAKTAMTAQIKFGQSKNKHPQYLMHLFDLCKNYFKIVNMQKPSEIISKPSEIVQNPKPKLVFSTQLLSELYIFRKMFYPQGKKIVPFDIRDNLSDIAIAYWYMDDGSLKGTKSKSVIFNTLGFTIDQVFVLCDIFRRKFNIFCWPRQQKNLNPSRKKLEEMKTELNFIDERNLKYQIYISSRSFETIDTLIRPYLHQEIIDSKWYPPTPFFKKGKISSSLLKKVNIGCYRRVVEKLDNGKTKIIEKILNPNLSQTLWSFECIILKNNSSSFLKMYQTHAPQLSSHQLFKNYK